MKNQLLYFLLLSIITFSCAKKRVSLFCPGEKSTHLVHKPLSNKEKKKVFVEKNKEPKNRPEISEELNLETSTETSISIDDNPIKERLDQNRKAKTINLLSPEEITPEAHRGSIFAFVIFFVGAIIGVSFVGTVWAIYNLFFLANKKEKFKLKGFSLAVVVTSMLIFGIVALLLYFIEMMYYYNPGLMIAFGILGFLFFICLASIFYYFAASNLFK